MTIHFHPTQDQRVIHGDSDTLCKAFFFVGIEVTTIIPNVTCADCRAILLNDPRTPERKAADEEIGKRANAAFMKHGTLLYEISVEERKAMVARAKANHRKRSQS